jgi:CHASE3 domain sensor protein
LVEAFIGARLFTADRADAAPAAVRITHEALLRTWPRLKQWLDEDRELLLARGRVAAAASRWDLEGRRHDLLLGRGKPLEEARVLLAGPDAGLSETERAFVHACVARANLGRRRRNAIVAAIVVLAFASAVASFAAYRGERRRREGETRLKQIAQLLAQDLRANTWVFLVTKSDRTLGMTDNSRYQIENRIQRLHDLTADDLELKTRIDSLSSLCERLCEDCADLIAHQSIVGDAGFARGQASITDPSEDTLASIQQVAAEIESVENTRIKRLAGPADNKAMAPTTRPTPESP